MNQAKTVTHNNESRVEEAQNFSQYLQSSDYDKNKDY